MASQNNLARELEKIGLTKGQADIYLLLAAHDELRIQKIAELASMPRSSVYENLRVLYGLGLAEEVVANNFKRVRAYPVSAMRHNIDEKIFDLQQMSAGLGKLEQLIAIAIPGTTPPSTAVRYYRGRMGARQLYWNTLKATDTVYVYSDWTRRAYIGAKFYERFVQESRVREIREKVLTNPTPPALESIRRYNIPLSPMARTHIKDIRFLDEDSMLVKGDTLIYDNIYAQLYLNNHGINGFEIESYNFTESQRSIFLTLWKMANPLAELL